MVTFSDDIEINVVDVSDEEDDHVVTPHSQDSLPDQKIPVSTTDRRIPVSTDSQRIPECVDEKIPVSNTDSKIHAATFRSKFPVGETDRHASSQYPPGTHNVAANPDSFSINALTSTANPATFGSQTTVSPPPANPPSKSPAEGASQASPSATVDAATLGPPADQDSPLDLSRPSVICQSNGNGSNAAVEDVEEHFRRSFNTKVRIIPTEADGEFSFLFWSLKSSV